MRTIPCGAKYESKIYVIDEQKLIFKIDCTCGDFIHRKIKRIGEMSDIKYFATPCKHLKPFVERLEKQGYKLKVPEEMIGEDKLTPQLRKQLMDRANNMCESLGCGSIILLQVHRETRGSNGGKYNMKNCKVLCKDCHEVRHANEFPWSKSK